MKRSASALGWDALELAQARQKARMPRMMEKTGMEAVHPMPVGVPRDHHRLPAVNPDPTRSIGVRRSSPLQKRATALRRLRLAPSDVPRRGIARCPRQCSLLATFPARFTAENNLGRTLTRKNLGIELNPFIVKNGHRSILEFPGIWPCPFACLSRLCH
jgi:hypothetical protein